MSERVSGVLVGLFVGAGVMLLATQATFQQKRTMQDAIVTDEMRSVRSEMQALSNMTIRASARIDTIERSLARASESQILLED